MADEFNKPNMVVPLAMSYDTRDVKSYTKALSGYDQRKINCFYDVVKNAVTGNTTLELVKRPGVDDYGQYSSVDTNYDSVLISSIVNVPVAVLHLRGGTGTTVARAVGTPILGTILTATGTIQPAFVDTTLISGTTYMVVQFRDYSTYAQRVFYSSDITNWTEITDGDFTGLTLRGKMEFLGGWSFIMTSNNRIYNSDLNSISAWTSGQFITKQIKQDRAAGLALLGQQLIAFGDETFEVFSNAGNPSGSPLSTVPSMAKEFGLGTLSGNGGQYAQPLREYMTHYYAVLGTTMYFVGRESGGVANAGLFMYNGQSVEKVSNSAVDRMLGEDLYYGVYKFGFFGHVGIVIQMTLPSATTQRWLVFLPRLNEWFEWNSSVFSPVNSDGIHLSCDSASGTKHAYQFESLNQWTDEGTAYTASVQFKLPKKANNRDIMRWCALDADTTTSASNVTVKFSDDDYQNFDSGRTIDLNTAEKRLMRCGSYKNRVVRLEHSANAEFRARNFLARIG